MPRSLREIRTLLAEIDSHVEPIAVNRPAGSDLKVIAHAVHNLVQCVENLAEHVAEGQRG